MARVNKSKTTDRIPLSLDGRGIKGEGDSKTFPPPCHSEQSEESKNSAPHFPQTVILASRQYPQGGANNKTKQPTANPLSLDGRGN